MTEQEYRCTTETLKYKDWGWFKDHLDLMAAAKAGFQTNTKIDFNGGPLPIKYGIAFSEWVLNTAEVRDIVFRRFVLDKYDNSLESNLLSDAASYFMRRNSIHTNASSSLVICYRPIAQVLQHNIAGPSSPEFSKLLTDSSWAFLAEG